MQKHEYRLSSKYVNAWLHLRERLVYIPGGLVLLYGFWLSLTA